MEDVIKFCIIRYIKNEHDHDWLIYEVIPEIFSFKGNFGQSLRQFLNGCATSKGRCSFIAVRLVSWHFWHRFFGERGNAGFVILLLWQSLFLQNKRASYQIRSLSSVSFFLLRSQSSAVNHTPSREKQF